MKVRQFKIRVNQNSHIIQNNKIWNNKWNTNKKYLWRTCLHAEIFFNKLLKIQGNRLNMQYGNINYLFINNCIVIQYFNFSYLYKYFQTLNYYDLATYYTLNNNLRKKKKKLLVVNKFNNLIILYNSNPIKNYLHQYTKTILNKKILFRQTYTWNNNKNMHYTFKKFKFYFNNYEQTDLNKIVYNKAKFYYFHPHHTYYYKKYESYKIHKFLNISKTRLNNLYYKKYSNLKLKRYYNKFNNNKWIINKEFVQNFIKNATYWLLYRKKLKKVKYYNKRAMYKIYPKHFIFKKKYFFIVNYNFKKIKNYNKIHFSFLIIKIYFYKKYLTKVIKNISLKWFNKKYLNRLISKKSLRRFILLTFFKFLTLNLIKLKHIYINNCCYKKKFKIEINNITIQNFHKFLFKNYYFSYYAKGFKQISKKLLINQNNYNNFLIYDINIYKKDSYLKKKTLSFIFYKIIKLYRARQNYHYIGSIIILLHTVTNINYSYLGSSIIATFLNLQLQKIPNKKLQRWFIGSCNEFIKNFIKIENNLIIKKLHFINIKGLQLDFKGRAVNLRRVFVRRKKYGHTYNTKFGYYDVNKSYNFDFFTNKWGSTSIRVSYFYNNFYHNNVNNFNINVYRRKLNNSLNYINLTSIKTLFIYKINYLINYKNIYINYNSLKNYKQKINYKNRRLSFDRIFTKKYRLFRPKKKYYNNRRYK